MVTVSTAAMVASLATRALPIAIRPARVDDVSLILSSWKRSAAAALVPRFVGQDVFRILNVAVDRYAAPATAVSVACLEDEADVVVAWLGVQGERIVYAYTKPRFRGLGIQKELLASLDGPAEWRGFDPLDWIEKG